MKKKTPTIPNDLLEKVKGFEDIFDEYLSEKQKNIITKKFQSSKNPDDRKAYKFIDFLDREQKRLLKINSLLTQKIPQASRFNQTNFLISKQEEKLLEIKKRLTDIYSFEGSQFNVEMGQIFNHIFSKKK